MRVARYNPADFPRLVERIRGRKPDGMTALYDALGVYLDGAAEDDGRTVLVLYTDGGDTRSAMSFSDVSGSGNVTYTQVGGRAFLKVYAVHRETGDQYLLIYEDIKRRKTPVQVIRFQPVPGSRLLSPTGDRYRETP